MTNFYTNYFEDISKYIAKIDNDDLISAANIIMNASKNNKKIIIAGNGGSAAMASHVCVDLVKAAEIRAVNFNEADLITCFANDYGYENWVMKAIEAYADEGDVVILISSSGQSQNIIKAADKSKELNLPLITLSGFMSNNPLRTKGDINFWLDSSQYNYVEMTHHIWLLAIVDYIISMKKPSLS